MPLIDMPVEALEKYNGANPKLIDFEEYWDKAFAEMKSVEPQVAMIKSEFRASTVECYDM